MNRTPGIVLILFFLLSVVQSWGAALQVADSSEFRYGVDHKRNVQLKFDAFGNGAPQHYTEKKVYVGEWMEVYYENAASGAGQEDWQQKTTRIYVDGPAGRVGTFTFTTNEGQPAAQELRVFHHDHLGSVDAITAYGSSSVLSDYAYDPWGQRRHPENPTHNGAADGLSPRGYTEHEMLDHLGLIHMNGRIYDPLLGRFLSADPYVQFPGNLQSYNRYSYTLNNPLKYTDSTGELVDIAVDVVSAGVGIYETGKAIHGKDWKGAAISGGGVVVDVVLAFVPFGTVGAGLQIKAGREIAEIVVKETVNGGGEKLVRETIQEGTETALKQLDGATVKAGKGSDGALSELAPTQEFKGGSHRDMTKPKGDGLDSHHMPDRHADPDVSVNDGSAIQMEPVDHKHTSSHGTKGRSAARYRKETAEMIKDGRKRDAMAREIKDARNAARTGSDDATKYYKAIQEMLEYARKKEQLPNK